MPPINRFVRLSVLLSVCQSVRLSVCVINLSHCGKLHQPSISYIYQEEKFALMYCLFKLGNLEKPQEGFEELDLGQVLYVILILPMPAGHVME